MKVKEALHHIAVQERKLEALGSRVTRLSEEGRIVTPILEETTSVANMLRDLRTAVAWTAQQVVYNGLTLGSYLIQRKTTQDLLDSVDLSILSPEVFTTYASFQEEVDNLDLIIDAINCQSDLQVPSVSVPEEKTKEE